MPTMATMPSSYDALPDRAQARLHASWRQQIAERVAALDFEERLRATGQPWAEADADGTVVIRQPGPAGG